MPLLFFAIFTENRPLKYIFNFNLIKICQRFYSVNILDFVNIFSINNLQISIAIIRNLSIGVFVQNDIRSIPFVNRGKDQVIILFTNNNTSTRFMISVTKNIIVGNHYFRLVKSTIVQYFQFFETFPCLCLCNTFIRLFTFGNIFIMLNFFLELKKYVALILHRFSYRLSIFQTYHTPNQI